MSEQPQLQEGVSFCFETVYSHPSKIDFIAQAKALGYQIIMVWIHLESPALSPIPRLLHQVRASIPLVHVQRIYDNSSAQDPFRPVLTLSAGSLRLHQEQLPHWAAACLADTPTP